MIKMTTVRIFKQNFFQNNTDISTFHSCTDITTFIF